MRKIDRNISFFYTFTTYNVEWKLCVYEKKLKIIEMLPINLIHRPVQVIHFLNITEYYFAHLRNNKTRTWPNSLILLWQKDLSYHHPPNYPSLYTLPVIRPKFNPPNDHSPESFFPRINIPPNLTLPE